METPRCKVSRITLNILEPSQDVNSIYLILFNCILCLLICFSVGLGSDFDGIGSVPKGLEDVSKYPDLVSLRDCGLFLYAELPLFRLLNCVRAAGPRRIWWASRGVT